jgi:hypothetical protein
VKSIEQVADEIRSQSERYPWPGSEYAVVTGMVRTLASEGASGFLTDSERLTRIKVILAALDEVQGAQR